MPPFLRHLPLLLREVRPFAIPCANSVRIGTAAFTPAAGIETFAPERAQDLVSFAVGPLGESLLGYVATRQGLGGFLERAIPIEWDILDRRETGTPEWAGSTSRCLCPRPR